jgi:hypothetical protein
MMRVPLHAWSASIAQTILSPACAEIDVILPCEVPEDDDHEFFVTTWCMHPCFTPNEKIIFILEPHVHSPKEEAELPGLR